MSGIDRQARVLELIARLTGELDESTRVNVLFAQRQAAEAPQITDLARLTVEERIQLEALLKRLAASMPSRCSWLPKRAFIERSLGEIIGQARSGIGVNGKIWFPPFAALPDVCPSVPPYLLDLRHVHVDRHAPRFHKSLLIPPQSPVRVERIRKSPEYEGGARRLLGQPACQKADQTGPQRKGRVRGT